MKGFRTVRGRMVALFGGVSALLLLAMSLVILLQVGNAQRQTIEDLAMEIVDARGSEVGRWLDGHRNEVRGISNLNIIREGDFEATSEYLTGRRGTLNPEYESVFYAEPSGRYITSLGVVGDISSRDYFQAIINGGQNEAISNALESLSSDSDIIVVAHEVRDFQGELLGLIGAVITLDILSDVIDGMRFGQDGIGMIVDGSGLVAAHPDPAVRMRLNLLDSREYDGLDTIGRMIVNGQSGIGDYFRPDGTRMHAVFSPIPRSPNWATAYLIPDSDMNAEVYRLIWFIAVSVLITLAAVLVAAVFVANLTARPIIDSVEQAKAVSQGDLTRIIPEKYRERRDEIGVLVQSLDEMQTQLTSVVQSIKTTARYVSDGSVEMKDAAQQISEGSEQLSSTAQSLSQGTSQQAASVEQVSASMEQMAANIQQSADNAQATEKIALQSSENAEKGGEAVRETVQAMKQIAEKISIIEDIARETNMLSLNAAIEAARAGEHGKGFAVVAQQVRKLAENSAVAAGEISSLSSHSVKVAEGAGELLAEMVPNIRRTADLVQEITASSKEMSAGASQVNSAVSQLDTVVQQSAASAEQVAATSEEQTAQTENLATTAEELSSQAQQLEEVIAFFRVQNDEWQKAAARPAVSAPAATGRSVALKKTAQKNQPERKSPPKIEASRLIRAETSPAKDIRKSRVTGITLSDMNNIDVSDDSDFEEL